MNKQYVAKKQLDTENHEPVIGTGGGIPCLVKNRTILRRNIVSIMVDNSFIELPGSYLQTLAKARAT